MMRSISSNTFIAQIFNICPYCYTLTGPNPGLDYITCHLNSSLLFCILCASKIPLSKSHWTDNGLDCYCENACKNFPKKICPDCTYITVRQ